MESVNNRKRWWSTNRERSSKASSESELDGKTLKKSRGNKNVSSTAQASSFSKHFEITQASFTESEGIPLIRADGSTDIDALQQLQDDIHDIGNSLLRNPRIDIALKYKAAVQRFLKSVVPLVHKKEVITKKQGVKTAHGYEIQEYKFTVIAKINKQLDDVLKLVLGTQTNQMQLMKSLDEMKGLIIDLLQ